MPLRVINVGVPESAGKGGPDVMILQGRVPTRIYAGPTE